jgi:glutamyl/glutaminyl-tRNA synthetase
MEWIARLPQRPVTRFAPSPTGELHLGHVANAVWTWGVAGAAGGTVRLRIEDHDRGRSRREHEKQILSDLAWLGLQPDGVSLASLQSGEPSPWRQSDCNEAYQVALHQLARATHVYACTCSRSQIARSVDMGQQVEGQEIPYPGTCRVRGHPLDTPGAGLRAVLPAGEVSFEDLRLGRQRQDPSRQCGDLLLRDATGNWTYQFAVTVDDLRHGVTLVVRGEDLLESTGRQILLARLLGRVAPAAFLHHPLIRNAAGAKLSKRDGAVSLRARREGGATAAEILEEAARLAGWGTTVSGKR